MYLNNWLDQGQSAWRLPGLKGIQILNNTAFLPKVYSPEIYSHGGRITQGKVTLNKNEYKNILAVYHLLLVRVAVDSDPVVIYMVFRQLHYGFRHLGLPRVILTHPEPSCV